MKSLEIRQKFFDFFVQHGHARVPSSSLIPAQDPTLLFTNAGMNQFKDLFLGKEARSYTRAVSIQKCMRAGGKHNDLENVGFTKRHLTFFEMMGNFSFGDYFKKEAIRFAWDFLTKELHLNPAMLYASVYNRDDEAYDIWHHDIGLSPERIVRLGEADNFWQMGDTGPCGPCSEIYVDRGLEFGCDSAACAPGCSCDRFLEIWNLVFMQFDRQSDGSDKLLAQTGVDTGMGLERLCAIMQNTDTVFETDLFAGILQAIERLTGLSYQKSSPDIQAAFRVLADHNRAACFAIADGCTPSNEGRGYVLRKIIRRAALFAQKLSTKNIFPQLTYTLVQEMGSIYPELTVSQDFIVKLLTSEIEKFAHNLVHGQTILEKYFLEQAAEKIITGVQAFKLYDTYGFPLELTKVIAQERDYTVDSASFQEEMEKQRMQSGKKDRAVETAELDGSLSTEFTGYHELESETHIIGLIVDNNAMEFVPLGERCWIITDKSPFFVERGGQVSDQGFVVTAHAEAAVLQLKRIGNAIALEIQAPEDLRLGDSVTLTVDAEFRANTVKNHTATHLLQAALIELLGKQVRQSGSVVRPDYLRFDFTYHENLTPPQIAWVEERVNRKIMENIPTKTTVTTYKEALEQGVIAIFGEKYNPESVRVVDVPGFSAELCGGTHVKETGEIGCFKITEISALSAGNRRIVAITGPKAVLLFQETFGTVKTLSQEFKVKTTEVLEAVKKQKDSLKAALQHVKELKKQLMHRDVPQLIAQSEMVGSVPFLYASFKDASVDELKEISALLAKAKPGIYFVVSPAERTSFVVTIPPTIASRLDVKQLNSWLKEQGFQGGGSGTVLQGTVQHVASDFENKIKEWLRLALM
jgi:alanyl-tRNA synthetase